VSLGSRVRHLVRAAVLVAVAAVVLPAASVAPATLSLTRTETARSVDFEDGVVWVLVLGSDARAGQAVTDGRTDAIQLLGIDFGSGAAAAIGVPRDSWVDLPGVGFDRINVALLEGGTDLAATAVEDLTGIAPDYVMVTGFRGFLAVTEELGGVDVEVERGFTTDDGGMAVGPGINRFDPGQALDFARTRENLTGSDFQRAAHHQALLVGFLRGLRAREDEEGFMERITLTALGGLETDLPPADLYRLAQALTQVDPAKVTGCLVTGSPFTTAGGALVIDPDVAQAHRLADDAFRDATLDDCS
jgi:polyisoprenyl-teichoic acid--peptidoglycan teichoic acid transferase